MFVNMQCNKEDHILIKSYVSLRDTPHRSCWKYFQVRFTKLSLWSLPKNIEDMAAYSWEVSASDRPQLCLLWRKWTLCSIRKVGQRHISQCVKFQGIPWSCWWHHPWSLPSQPTH